MYNFDSLGTFKTDEKLSRFTVSKLQLNNYLNNIPKRLDDINKVIEENKERLDRDTKLKEFMVKHCENIKKINEYINSVKNMSNNEENNMTL